MPFILWGFSGDWPEPIGPTDVRGLVSRHLGAPSANPARFVPDASRRLFQYAPDAIRPNVIGLQGAYDRLEYRLPRARFARVTPDETRGPAPEDEQLRNALIRDWEAVQAQRRAANRAARP